VELEKFSELCLLERDELEESPGLSSLFEIGMSSAVYFGCAVEVGVPPTRLKLNGMTLEDLSHVPRSRI